MNATVDKLPDKEEVDKLKIPLEERKSVSLLLGAGFSAPKGYPVGDQINDELQNFDKNIDFAPDGSICSNKDGSKPIFHIGAGLNPHQKFFIFCQRLIKEYSKGHQFNYEEFYDFINSKELDQYRYKKLLSDLLTEYESFEYYVYNLNHIYNQMVAHLLKDIEGKTFYDNEPDKIGYIQGYNGFLSYLSKIQKDLIINIHTLNHDLLFESFNKTEYLNGNISDGFIELGSPYYGKLYCNEILYHCRLKRFTNHYDTPIRLFKLHGSLDYVPFYNTNKFGEMTLDNYVKITYGIGYGAIVKENKYKKVYDSSPFAYHADFLTGTTYKIGRYGHGIFKTLFGSFKANLQKAEKLIIIGYGCKDKGINEIIKDNFDFKNKPVFIVDKYTEDGSPVYKFKDEINARLIKAEIENLTEEMFQ